MICASCGANEMRPDVRDLKQTCKGRVNIVKDVHADWCAHCGEAELDAGDGPVGKEADRVSDEAEAFIEKVDQEESD
jgi:YgiT-type zinc finger domain-containing protein